METLGRYRIDTKLTEGGMGSVYLASDVDGRLVVLKVPHRHDADAMTALSDEARTGLRLKHPAIVETLDFFVENGQGVLVVAYIDGKTLYELRKAGPLPSAAVATLGTQLASALDAIHNATDEDGRPLDVLHRDISPNNVMVDASGQARLIDLGIARSSDRQQKSTQVGMVKGTLRYLAPEILAGGDHSRATDLWALGVTLWESALARYAVPGDEVVTLRAAMDGTLAKLLPGESLEREVQDAIQALVCPIGNRLQNARAAHAVFTRLATRFSGGRDALSNAVKSVMSRAPASSNAQAPAAARQPPRASEPAKPLVDQTELLQRTLIVPALPTKSDVDLVFTMTVPKDAVFPEAIAPTMRIDEQLVRPGFASAATDKLPIDAVETPLDTPREGSATAVPVTPIVPGLPTDSSDTLLLPREPAPREPAPRELAPTKVPLGDHPIDKSLSIEVILDEEDSEKTE